MSRFRQSLEQAVAANRSSPPVHVEWPRESVPEILRTIWQAYDRLCESALARVDIRDTDLQIERSVCALLSDEIQIILIEKGGFASYLVSHERWETETLDPKKSSRPPQYDICFVWNDQRELKWPCEAKVLRGEKDSAAYVKDITDAFMTCIYGPFSSSGAMLGLLLDGSPGISLKSIEAKLRLTVERHPDFPDRAHAFTNLERTSREGKAYPLAFTLHHLILHLRPHSQAV